MNKKLHKMMMKRIILLVLACVYGGVSYAQTAVINEFSTDPSMFDGSGGEFIELHCPAGGGACDISCWVVSDGQGLITIPDGTTIPDGGYYLIGHAPALTCDSCDFFGIPIDLNTATCGCLTGGSYGVGIDGNPAMILGRSGNAGEMMILYDNTATLLEGWQFDNGSAAFLPMGGTIPSAAMGACPSTNIYVHPPDSPQYTNIGPSVLGCNTSYTRDTDGSSTWILDDHPTPGASNANMGDNAFEYQYRIDGGAWITIPKNGTGNVDTHSDTICVGDSIQFRIQIENYQHATLEVFDSTGRYGSYFTSPSTGLTVWSTVEGLSNALGDTLRLVSATDTIPVGNSAYVLQWSDFKNGQGSYSSGSTNECYERLNFTLTRNEMVDSATIICTDATSGISAVTTYPASVDGFGRDVEYVLYDDVGDLSNPIDSNQSGLFQLSVAATTGYYVQVQGLCNNVIAIDRGAAFCLAVPPCPQIIASSFVKNGSTCGNRLDTIHEESFEGAPNVGYSTTGVFSDGSNDYFDLIGNGADPTGVPAYTGADGTQYWAGEDTQDGGNPVGSGISTMTISGINIAGAIGLQVEGLFAAGSNSAFDEPDYIQIFAQVDGGGFVLVGAFEGVANFNTALREDTNLDGTGNGTTLTTAFQNFIFPIASLGATLDIRIDMFMSAGDEAAAFDNIIVVGAVADTCDACPTDTLTFSVTGFNLPAGGQIDWYEDASSGFDPYNGEGTYIGSSYIPVGGACASATLAFNEINYRPLTNNGQNPDAGDMIELIGPPGMDLSCFVLTDGDWTITFPPGSIIPADGLFTIGNDNVHGAGTFDLDAENCGCFTDGPSGDGLLILTDGGEYVSLFDASGTFVQGIMYGSPSAGNTPPNGSLTTGGVINTIGAAGCPASVTIPGAGSFETAPGGVAAGTSLIRDPDGSGAWTTQAGGSMNDCNVAGVPPIVPDFDYVVPVEACNEVRNYIGIINPHPNTVACPNTDPSATTDTFLIQVICPEAILDGDTTICENNAPINLPVSTTGITSGTGASFVYNNNGVIDTVIGTVINDTLTFSVSNTGDYTGMQIIPSTGCLGPADSTAAVVVIPIPSAASLPSPVSVCSGDTVLLAATGSSTFEWSLVSNFTPSNISTDFVTAAPDSVYVRTINQSDDDAVSCLGGVVGVRVDTITCELIILDQELLDFTATKVDEHQALLEWNSTIIQTHLPFYVERSADGITFETIGTQVQKNGTIGLAANYQLPDNLPINGWNYYRLRYPTEQGTEEYSSIRALHFGEPTIVISLYPNPVRDKLQLGFSEPLEDVKIKVLNALGQRLMDNVLSGSTIETTISVEHLATGVYIIQVNANNQVYTRRWVKK
ncbi:MAG: T9SS type A sorting domain-containing protein [Aureispira sp.]|nr:T9SS type A sorting domain-containing protein [Aureispira sp.]